MLSGEIAKMLLFRFLAISLSIMVSGSSSVGSDSESLLTCSKFHFEENVLEKLVRLEHKMEIHDQMIKRWEELFSSKIDKMDTSIKHNEIFVESLRDADLQEQSRLNDSYQNIVEKFIVRSKTETEIYGKQMEVMLELLSTKTNENVKRWENTLSSRLNKMDEAMNQTEKFVEVMRETQIQEQSRLNDSYQRIVENVQIQSANQTNINRDEMRTMLKSLSVKFKEFSAAEKKRGNAMELMQYTLHQEQMRFNQSFDRFLENTKHHSNNTIYELIAKQQKDYEALLKTRDVVAFSAYRIYSQTFTRSGKNFKFDKIRSNIGNGYDSSTGIFTAPRQGVYHFTAYAVSASGKNFYFRLLHNSERTARSFVTGDGHKTGILDVILNLKKGDSVSVDSFSSYIMHSDPDNFASFSGYLIA